MDNRRLIKELFIDINYYSLSKKDDDSNNILKSKMNYLKTATSYIPMIKLYKLYKDIKSIYEERSNDKYLEEIEYNMIIYFVYLLNSDILSKEEKKNLIENILKLYELNLSNDDIKLLEENNKIKIYSYTKTSSDRIRREINSMESINNNTLMTLEESIDTTVLGYLNILNKDISILTAKHKKKIK